MTELRARSPGGPFGGRPNSSSRLERCNAAGPPDALLRFTSRPELTGPVRGGYIRGREGTFFQMT